MDYLDFSIGKSSRRELQRPHPTPLKVHTDSRKIRKPPVGPLLLPPHHHHAPPVITYVVSPKVIHTSPSEFMTLVQRLTGPSSPTIPRSQYNGDRTTSLDYSPKDTWGHIEMNSWGQKIPYPITTQKPNKSPAEKKQEVGDLGMDRRTSFFPGILSSAPAAPPTKPSNFFPTPSDQNPLNFYQDLSPSLRGNNKNYMEGNFMPNHSSYFLSPHTTTSTTPALDLFNDSFTFKREN